MSRRRLRNQFKNYRPPALPFHNNNNNNNNNNPYANNPPPPTNTDWRSNSYANNVTQPQTAYQPSMAAQYKAPQDSTNEAGHEHGYEWEQAREQERLERLQANNTAPAPPSYDTAAGESIFPLSSSISLTAVQGTHATNTYAPPPGPPPTKAAQ